jgi:phenylpropionate dioxygenase-like ring-hydroxylating dioxygenase large terminal subunit
MESLRTFKDQWFPIARVQDIKAGRSYPKQLFGHRIILFRNENRDIVCLRDECSHMGIPLSQGCVKKGRVQCCYHGWTFNGQGECTDIPRLTLDSTKIREKASVPSYPVRQQYGMVWITVGDPSLCRDADKDALLLQDNDEESYYSTQSLTHYEFPSHYSIASLNAFDFSHVHIHKILKHFLPVSTGHYKRTHIQTDRAHTTFVDARGENVDVVMQRSPTLQISFKGLSRLRLTRWVDVRVDLQVFGSPVDKDRSLLFAFPIFRGRPFFLLKLLRPVIDFVLRFSFAEDIEIFRFQQSVRDQGGLFYKNLSPLDASWIKVHHWLQSFDESGLYENTAKAVLKKARVPLKSRDNMDFKPFGRHEDHGVRI